MPTLASGLYTAYKRGKVQGMKDLLHTDDSANESHQERGARLMRRHQARDAMLRYEKRSPDRVAQMVRQIWQGIEQCPHTSIIAEVRIHVATEDVDRRVLDELEDLVNRCAKCHRRIES